jgi:hypothetical protein
VLGAPGALVVSLVLVLLEKEGTGVEESERNGGGGPARVKEDGRPPNIFSLALVVMTVEA